MLVEGQKCNNRCGVSASDASHGSDRYQSNLQRISIAFPLYFHCVFIAFPCFLATSGNCIRHVTAFASDCILGLALDVVGPVFSGSSQSGETGIQSITDRPVQNGKDVCSALERENRGIGCIAKRFFQLMIRKDIS